MTVVKNMHERSCVLSWLWKCHVKCYKNQLKCYHTPSSVT